MTHDGERDHDPGLPAVHQGDPGADLGRDHQPRVHAGTSTAVVLRRPARPARRCACSGRTARPWGDEIIQESEPPRRLVVGWRSLYNEEMAAQSRAEPRSPGRSSRAKDGVCLVHAHPRPARQLSPKTALNVSGEGWMGVLSGLKTLLETGQAMHSWAGLAPFDNVPSDVMPMPSRHAVQRSSSDSCPGSPEHAPVQPSRGPGSSRAISPPPPLL